MRRSAPESEWEVLQMVSPSRLVSWAPRADVCCEHSLRHTIRSFAHNGRWRLTPSVCDLLDTGGPRGRVRPAAGPHAFRSLVWVLFLLST